jgi:hypothetical protein
MVEARMCWAAYAASYGAMGDAYNILAGEHRNIPVGTRAPI